MAVTRQTKIPKYATPRLPVAQVARRALRLRLRKVRRTLPRAARGGRRNERYVHDLRVQSRQASAALKLYREFLPHRATRRLGRRLRRIRRAAGTVRGLDVFVNDLGKFRASRAGRRLVRRARRARKEALGPVRKIRKRVAREHLWREVEALLSRLRRDKVKSPRYSPWARAQLRPLARHFAADFPRGNADIARLHRFRIRCKKLRYALELLAGAFEPRLYDSVCRRVRELQELLGTVNDCDENGRRLARWLTRDGADGGAAILRANARRLTKAQRSLAARRGHFLQALARDLQRLLAAPAGV